MDIGKLRHRVKIQTYTDTAQLSGAYTLNSWTTIATVWAFIDTVKGLVRFDTKQIGNEITHKIIMRYRPYVTTENWLELGNRRFRIRFVKDFDERERYLELLCQEEGYESGAFEASVNTVGDDLQGG